MAISVASFAASAFNSATTPKTVTSVAWSSGDIIVVAGITEVDGTTVGPPTNANLTFSQQAATNTATGNNESEAWIWTATAGSGQTGQTISCPATGGGQFGIGVWVITGSPTGVGVTFANNNESTTSLTVAAGSIVVYAMADWQATAAGRTGATGSGTLTERVDSTSAGIFTQWMGDWVGVSSGSIAFGLSSYASMQVAQVAVEITGGSSGGASVSPTVVTATASVPSPTRVTTAPLTVIPATTANSASSTAALSFAAGKDFAIGDMAVVCISADNNGTNGVSSLSSVTDAQGNTYTARQTATYDPGAAAAGQTVGIYTAPITTALAATDNISVNFSPNTTSKAVAVWKVSPETGYTVTYDTGATTAGSATGTPTVTTSSITSGHTVIAALAAESNATVTGDSDTTNGNWSTQQTAVGNTGTSGTSSRLATQWKTVTSTATQTYNPTLTSSDNLLAWISLSAAAAGANVSASVVTATANVPAPTVTVPTNASVSATVVTATASVPAPSVSAGTSELWTFTQADGTPTGFSVTGADPNLTVVNQKLSTNGSGWRKGITSHTVDLSGDWEVIFEYDAIAGTVGGSGGLSLWLLNTSDASGWGVFFGDYPTGGGMTFHVQRVNAGGVTFTNVTNDGAHPTSGIAKLDYDASTEIVRVETWNGSGWTTEQTWDSTGDTRAAGDASGGYLFIGTKSDTSPTDEITVDNVYLNPALDGLLPAIGQTVSASVVTATASVPAPTVSASSSASVTATIVTATASVPAPTVAAGSTATATVVTGTTSVPAPTISVGVTITATVVTALASVPSATASGGASVSATVVTAVGEVPTPSVSTAANANVTAVVVTAAASVPSPTASAGVGVTATVVTALVSVPAPTAGAGVTVTATVVTATASVPTAAASAGSSVTATVVTAVVSVPTPSVSTSGNANVSAAVVTALASVLAPTIATGAGVTATVVTATGSVPNPSVAAGGGASVIATVVTAVTSVPAPTAGAGVGITATVVTVLAGVPAPSVTTAGNANVTAVVVTATVDVPGATVVVGFIALVYGPALSFEPPPILTWNPPAVLDWNPPPILQGAPL